MAELVGIDDRLLPSVEIHPIAPELYRRKVSASPDVFMDEETRAEAMEIIRSLIERIEAVPPDETRGPCTVRLVAALTSMLAFVTEHGGCDVKKRRRSEALSHARDKPGLGSPKARPPLLYKKWRF